ncbi:MAG: hypothetical protein V4730_05960 [Pseudomonadota bacterium]
MKRFYGKVAANTNASTWSPPLIWSRKAVTYRFPTSTKKGLAQIPDGLRTYSVTVSTVASMPVITTVGMVKLPFPCQHGYHIANMADYYDNRNDNT